METLTKSDLSVLVDILTWALPVWKAALFENETLDDSEPLTLSSFVISTCMRVLRLNVSALRSLLGSDVDDEDAAA